MYQEISQGNQIMVNPYDEHEVHIEGHEEYQRGATYKGMGPEINQIMEAHVNEHRQQLMAAMAPMVQQQLPGMGQTGSGSPQGASNGTSPTPTPTGGQ